MTDSFVVDRSPIILPGGEWRFTVQITNAYNRPQGVRHDRPVWRTENFTHHPSLHIVETDNDRWRFKNSTAAAATPAAKPKGRSKAHANPFDVGLIHNRVARLLHQWWGQNQMKTGVKIQWKSTGAPTLILVYRLPALDELGTILVGCNVKFASIMVSLEGAMKLTKNERMELQRQVGARNGRADAARHARLILLLADGLITPDSIVTAH